jgi:hypothetical protein
VIDFYGLFHRDLQRPVAAKTDIPLAGRRMDIDTQPARRRFSLQERDMGMGLGIFLGYAKIKDMRV